MELVILTKTHVTLARKLKSFGGRATAETLESSYIKIEPLIRNKYVRVTSFQGTAIYALTDEGREWLDMEDTPKPTRRRKSRQRA